MEHNNGVWSFVLFNDAWSQKGHSASRNIIIIIMFICSALHQIKYALRAMRIMAGTTYKYKHQTLEDEDNGWNITCKK